MDRKKIAWRDQAKAQLRAIDQPTALRLLRALAHFAATGEGDVKRLQDIEPPDFRLRVGDYRPLPRPRPYPLHHRCQAPPRSLPLTSNTHRTTRLISASPPPLFHLSSHSGQTPAARTAVKGARPIARSSKRAQTLDGYRSEGYSAPGSSFQLDALLSTSSQRGTSDISSETGFG
jgi:hypothetical protein